MVENSHPIRALRAMARLLSDLGLSRLAAELLQYAWKHGLRSAPMALAIANARLKAAQNQAAAAFFREACKREPANAEARAGLVCSLFREGFGRDAARQAAVLATLAPCAEVWVLVAELRKRVGDTIGSLAAFRQAAEAKAALDRFVLGEAILGVDAWSNLAGPLADAQKSRSAVGVGTHLVRSRSSVLARVFGRRKTAALFAFVHVLGSAVALAHDPDVSPTPGPRKIAQVPPSPVVASLPTAGSLTARIVQLNSGLVLEREEGAGLFPAEPSRFTFRGGSWTQTRIEIDGFDVTDPLLGGRALVWGAVEIGDVDVRTDSKGTTLVHTHSSSVGPGRARFLAQGNLGLFDARGSTADPIPSLARGHSLFDGVLAASGSSSLGRTNWNGALSGADVSRSERASDRKRATARLGLEGRVNHMGGADQYQALAMIQSRRAPFGLTPAETRATGLMLGTSWARRSPNAGLPNAKEPPETAHARVSYLRGTTRDPIFPAALPFERLVDGPPNLQAPYHTVGQKFQIEAGKGAHWFSTSTFVSAAARFSRATGERGLTQASFRALESLNGAPAREWTFAGQAPSRLVETRASAAFSFSSRPSDRTRVKGTLELQRVTIGDRDGARLLGSTKAHPEIRFEWSKSEKTDFFAEASIGNPPVPLVSFEAVTVNTQTASARLWRDLNKDGQTTASELGLEVARLGSGAIGLDPDLRLPTLRRVIVGFKTKVRGLGIRATLFARRDVDLVETARNPPGSEVAATRNIPDPSGDILGASDDQILPIVEESLRSFSSSQFLLTNPAGHRALGEGAELGFETNGRHIHWGLVGAAFRASGRGGNRGLRVFENDFGVVGESFDRANADTFGYGRLFFDRAYSLRMYLTANGIAGFTFGALGRYDDGQPFARLVIQDDLPQGPDFVQAIPRGRARLHYTLSVDARLAKRLKISGVDLEVSASVFNALGSQFEAEENVVWLPAADYRKITMVQPPRAVIIGIRIER